MDIATVILATYAITLTLTWSEGPFGSLYKLRANKKVDNFGLLNCFLCTAFWVSLIVCLISNNLSLFFIAWGGATLIDRLVTR